MKDMIPQLPAPTIERTPLELLCDKISKWLYLEDTRTIDVLLATYYINVHTAHEPIWLLLVAPPGGGKTELIRGIQDEKCLEVSNLTENTLISGLGEDESLLKKIEKENKKLLLMKDFTSVLSKNQESMKAIFATLREIYDGTIIKHFGTGESIEWRGKLGLIAGVTDVIDEHYGVINSLGGRFIQWRPGHNREKEVSRAMRNIGKETTMREEIGRAFDTFCSNITSSPISISPDDYKFVSSIAEITGTLRTEVKRDYRRKEVVTVPSSEIPTRLSKNYLSMLMGLLSIQGKHVASSYEYNILKKIALDTVPKKRVKILRNVFDNHGGRFTAQTIAEEVNLPATTVKYTLEEMNALKYLDMSSEGKKHYFSLRDDIREMFEQIDLFNEDTK